MYKRVLLKLSGEALASENDIFDKEVLKDLARQLKTISEMGVEVAIVVGGGNFVRGKMADEIEIDRAQVDSMGMLGTVINALAIQGALENLGVETRVQTAIEMQKVAEPYIPRRAVRHLEKGRIVVFGAGTGSAFFSTDTAAVLRAVETECEIFLKATLVDGVYDKDPHKYADAVKFKTLEFTQVLKDELAVMDSTAASMCRDNKMPMLVFDLSRPDNIYDAVMGEDVGTIVSEKNL